MILLNVSGRKKKYISLAAAILLLLTAVPLSFPMSAADVKESGTDAEGYLCTVDLSLYNPCNSEDMDKDAVNEFWFDFTYTDKNGYGSTKTYRFDMSWSDGKNKNSDILKKTFIRADDNACDTSFSLRVPGIVTGVSVHLNMDGGERLGFTVDGIFLGGYRINTDTDYVSSAYYDSEATVKCTAPAAAIVSPDTSPVKDQYGGVFTPENITAAKSAADLGDYRMYYDFEIKKQEEYK